MCLSLSLLLFLRIFFLWFFFVFPDFFTFSAFTFLSLFLCFFSYRIHYYSFLPYSRVCVWGRRRRSTGGWWWRVRHLSTYRDQHLVQQFCASNYSVRFRHTRATVTPHVLFRVCHTEWEPDKCNLTCGMLPVYGGNTLPTLPGASLSVQVPLVATCASRRPWRSVGALIRYLELWFDKTVKLLVARQVRKFRGFVKSLRRHDIRIQ
jgi:hypothetical protein